MSRKQSDGNAGNDVPLDRYGIYRVPTLDRADQCPESIYKVFQAVYNSKSLRVFHFVAERKDSRSGFDTCAAHDYDMTLGLRAYELAHRCCDPETMDWAECTWVQNLLPPVFLFFDRKEDEELDEKRPFHHCLACRHHFPPGSRPIINSSHTDRSRKMKTAKTQHGAAFRQDFKLCKSRDQHFNLPNFGISEQVSYRDDDGDIKGSNSIQIPDATIGLCTYDLTTKSWDKREDLINNDRVKLFEKKALIDCLKHFKLEGPYKDSSRYTTAAYPMFGFGLWEAKKSTAENHFKIFRQTARKLATLLRWQRRIFDEARCEDACPLAWFFASVGSSWEICACYEKKNPLGHGYLYPTVVLWSGRSEDSDGALQLLFIVDIIRFWAEYTYKPIIGTCLSRLQAIKAGGSPVPLGDTLWESQITLNEANTPWFFKPRNSFEASSASPSANKRLGVSLRERSSDRRSSDQPTLRRIPLLTSRQSSQQRHQRDTTPAAKNYVIPEIDRYNWILDRDPGYGDLLLIRIDKNGTRRRPIVFFDSVGWRADWNDPEINSILADEMKRHHSDTLPRFTVNQKGRDYVWQCSRSSFRHIRSETQFCAILPLDRDDYHQQRQKSEKQERQLFEPLESLLGLPVLLADIDRAYEQWCKCHCPWNTYSQPMIECNNAKCNLVWYHKKCVGLDEHDDREFWLCETCCKIPEKDRLDTEDLDMEYGEKALASSNRIQRTRKLRRAWNKHAWPEADAVRREFRKVTLNLDIVKSAAHTIRRKGVQRDTDPPRYWVISKDKPHKLVMASPRKQQLVYHMEVEQEDDEDGSDTTDEDETYFNDEAVDGIEDALDGMSLGQPRTERA